MIRLATENDLARIKQICNQNREFIGFVMKVALKESIEKKSLLVYEKDDQVVGFAHFHKRLDGWNTLHELVVDKNYQGQGIGKELYVCIPLPMRLKTTVDNMYAQKFYELNGMQKVRTEQGKKRELIVFEKGFNLTLKNKNKQKFS
jgi:N-acetylglutamate synthase-like GNAT family acetyltransferase